MQRHEGAFKFNIAVDNTAAAAALRHMYSSNVVACHELDRLWEKLSSRGCFHPRFLRKVGGQCVRMASRNVYFALMDAKRRAAATTTGRAGPDIVQRCWNEIQAQRKGWRLGAHKESIELSASEGVRHRDLGDDDVSPDSLWCDLDPMDRPSAQGHARRSFMDTESPSL